jgi:hypothetical protein
LFTDIVEPLLGFWTDHFTHCFGDLVLQLEWQILLHPVFNRRLLVGQFFIPKGYLHHLIIDPLLIRIEHRNTQLFVVDLIDKGC